MPNLCFAKSLNVFETIFYLIISSPDDSLLQNISKLSKEDFPEYQPHDYSSEGANIDTMSLDKLSICSNGDDLDFQENLGPKFSALEEICQQALKEKNIKL